MTSPFEANRSALQAHRPDLVEIARVEPGPGLEIRPDPDGSPNLVDLSLGRSWYSPSVGESLRALVDKPDLGTRRLIVCLGLGLGHELRHILAHRRIGQLLVIEQDPEVFRHAMRATDLRDAIASETVDFVVGQSLDSLGGTLHGLCMKERYLVYARSVTILATEGALARDSAYVEGAVRRFREMLVAAIQMFGNCPFDALLGLENILKNFKNLVRFPNAALSAGRLAGRPAIVAAAGPTLTQHLPLLREVQDRIPIFCPDTSVRILQNAGIRPHLATSRERTEGNVRHFEGLPAHDFALVGFPVLKPRVFELFPGPTALLYRRSDWYSWLEPEGPSFTFNGSAGNLAYRVAALLGCDPIILVGQDLCFAEGGSTHAPGALDGPTQTEYHQLPKVMVPGNRGGMVETTPIWLKFLRYYELDIHELPAKVINATARGAHIRGTEVMDLEQALRMVPLGSDPRGEILSLFPPREGSALRRTRERLLRLLDETRRRLRFIRERTGLGVKYAALARERFVPPSVSHPDLSVLLLEDPYKTIDGVRGSLFHQEPRIFKTFMLPLFQGIFISLEIRRYGEELTAPSAEALGRAVITLAEEWFGQLDELARRAEALLAEGDAALGDSPAPKRGAKRPSAPRKARGKGKGRVARARG